MAGTLSTSCLRFLLGCGSVASGRFSILVIHSIFFKARTATLLSLTKDPIWHVPSQPQTSIGKKFKVNSFLTCRQCRHLAPLYGSYLKQPLTVTHWSISSNVVHYGQAVHYYHLNNSLSYNNIALYSIKDYTLSFSNSYI